MKIQELKVRQGPDLLQSLIKYFQAQLRSVSANITSSLAAGFSCETDERIDFSSPKRRMWIWFPARCFNYLVFTSLLPTLRTVATHLLFNTRGSFLSEQSQPQHVMFWFLWTTMLGTNGHHDSAVLCFLIAASFRMDWKLQRILLPLLRSLLHLFTR